MFGAIWMEPTVAYYDGKHCSSSPDHCQPERGAGLDRVGNDPCARRTGTDSDRERR